VTSHIFALPSTSAPLPVHPRTDGKNVKGLSHRCGRSRNYNPGLTRQILNINRTIVAFHTDWNSCFLANLEETHSHDNKHLQRLLQTHSHDSKHLQRLPQTVQVGTSGSYSRATWFKHSPWGFRGVLRYHKTRDDVFCPRPFEFRNPSFRHPTLRQALPQHKKWRTSDVP
jgi:hypothetical protein